jgi:hypothetical protein
MVQRLKWRSAAIVLAAAAISLSGCATQTQPYPRTPPPPSHPPQQPGTTHAPGGPGSPVPTPGPVIAPPPQTAPAPGQPKAQSTVTLALQDESERAAAAGDLPKAIQIIERAIRIQPDKAELWLDLARLHLKEGNPAQAEQFARKALLFTGQRYDLEQQAWVIIADAKAAKG